ncbi:hypothetical protein ACOSQ3_031292 [Xanthoceras sorbifolium]
MADAAELPCAVIWRPPSAGTFKLNTQASASLEAGLAGFGVMIRNEFGLIMAVGSIRVTGFFCPQVAEALAIFHGLRFASQTGLFPLHVESDCLEVIKVLQDDSIFHIQIWV